MRSSGVGPRALSHQREGGSLCGRRSTFSTQGTSNSRTSQFVSSLCVSVFVNVRLSGLCLLEFRVFCCYLARVGTISMAF